MSRIDRRGDFGGEARPTEHVALTLAPFAAAWTVALLAALVGERVRWGEYAAAIALGVLTGLLRLTPWRGRLRGIRELVPSLVFLGSATLLRGAAGGANSGFTIVALLPVFWTSLHGDRRQLFGVIVALAAFFLGPLLLVGPPVYPHTQYRVALLYVTVGAVLGLTTQWLVSQVRFQAGEAEHRERMLERVASAVRELSISPAARIEVCEAARTISNASLAVLFEPSGKILRSTAMAGIDQPELQIKLEDRSVLRDVFVSRRSFLSDSGEGLTNTDRITWGDSEHPASVLFEPVVRNNEAVGVLVVCWAQPIRSGGSRATAIALLAHEVSAAIERADLMMKLTDMASTDALTGLPNRRAWDTSLSRALVTYDRVAVAMLDFDHFKDFNDSRGHPAGDRLLKEAAAAWRGELRAGDVLARIGGEEFALLLPECALEDALAVLERLRHHVPYQQTCSAGIVMHESGGASGDLLARADTALYEAKAAGRDRVALA